MPFFYCVQVGFGRSFILQIYAIPNLIGKIPVKDLPGKVDWPFAIMVVDQVLEAPEVGVEWCAPLPPAGGPQEQIDGVRVLIVSNEVLNGAIDKTLLRLGLPTENSVLGDPFVELMGCLALAECHKEDIVSRTARYLNDSCKPQVPV